MRSSSMWSLIHKTFQKRKSCMRSGSITSTGVRDCGSRGWSWDSVQKIDPKQNFRSQHSQFVDRCTSSEPLWLAIHLLEDELITVYEKNCSKLLSWKQKHNFGHFLLFYCYKSCDTMTQVWSISWKDLCLNIWLAHCSSWSSHGFICYEMAMLLRCNMLPQQEAGYPCQVDLAIYR